jgi:hypothetical protein
VGFQQVTQANPSEVLTGTRGATATIAGGSNSITTTKMTNTATGSVTSTKSGSATSTKSGINAIISSVEGKNGAGRNVISGGFWPTLWLVLLWHSLFRRHIQ